MIFTYRKNWGPPTPIACEVWPQTRRVNSFPTGSGRVFGSKYVIFYFYIFLFSELYRKNNSQSVYYPSLAIAGFVCVSLQWIVAKSVLKVFRMRLLSIELRDHLKETSKHWFPDKKTKYICKYSKLQISKEVDWNKSLTFASIFSTFGNSLRIMLRHLTTMYSILVISVSMFSHFCFEFPTKYCNFTLLF